MTEKQIPYLRILASFAAGFSFRRVNLTLFDPLSRIEILKRFHGGAPLGFREGAEPVTERLFGEAWGAGLAHCPPRMIHSLVFSGNPASGGVLNDPERGWYVQGG